MWKARRQYLALARDYAWGRTCLSLLRRRRHSGLPSALTSSGNAAAARAPANDAEDHSQNAGPIAGLFHYGTACQWAAPADAATLRSALQTAPSPC